MRSACQIAMPLASTPPASMTAKVIEVSCATKASVRGSMRTMPSAAWLTMVRALHVHPGAVPSVGWLIRVVRSRFIDDLRRQQRLPNKLALVWSADRSRDDADDMRTGEMIDALDRVRPEHRAVLLMFYVDDLAANDVARELGISRSATYELLHHAKAELRDVVAGARRA